MINPEGDCNPSNQDWFSQTFALILALFSKFSHCLRLDIPTRFPPAGLPGAQIKYWPNRVRQEGCQRRIFSGGKGGQFDKSRTWLIPLSSSPCCGLQLASTRIRQWMRAVEPDPVRKSRRYSSAVLIENSLRPEFSAGIGNEPQPPTFDRIHHPAREVPPSFRLFDARRMPRHEPFAVRRT